MKKNIKRLFKNYCFYKSQQLLMNALARWRRMSGGEDGAGRGSADEAPGDSCTVVERILRHFDENTKENFQVSFSYPYLDHRREELLLTARNMLQVYVRNIEDGM